MGTPFTLCPVQTSYDYVAEMALNPEPLAFTYQVLGLQVCITTPGSLSIFQSGCLLLICGGSFYVLVISSLFGLSCQYFLLICGLSFPPIVPAWVCGFQ